MRKLDNSYRLPNGASHIPADDVRKCLSDFSFFMGNYAQILNKERVTVPFELNAAQKKIFEVLLPMVDPKTRLNKRHTVVLAKSRQIGASVSIVAFINYICAYVNGLENMSIAHVFPVGDTLSKFYLQKTVPIVTGVHPDLFPYIERETLSSSILTHYRDTKGLPRNNYYELIASAASSIRSSTVNVAIFDEVAYYRNPEQLEDAIMPAMPDYGFSLVVYASTFDDKKSTYFKDKLKTALDNPDDFTILFIPWYLTYPERPQGIDINTLKLTEYDEKVILPALKKDNIPKERWGDCIDWYHRRKLITTNMAYEYPTTVEEIITANDDEHVFRAESLERQKDNIMEGAHYRLVTDVQTGQVSANLDESGEAPFVIFKNPEIGERYRIAIDPIASNSSESDFFAAHVFRIRNNEQVAVLHVRGVSVEDCADLVLCMAKLYNRAELCPESNIAESLVLLIRAQRYYNWYYQTDSQRAKKEPGIRTTVSTKENMINRIQLMLDNDKVILHDKETIDELGRFVKKRNKSGTIKMEAQGKGHDDLVMSLAIYAASLDQKGLTGERKIGWHIL